MNTMKKIGAITIATILGGSLFGLAGCTSQKDATIAELQEKVSGLEAGKESINADLSDVQTRLIEAQDKLAIAIENKDADSKTITDLETNVKELSAEKEADKLVIEDYKAEITALQLETTEASFDGLEVIDDLKLNADIGIHTLDDSDISKLLDTKIEFNDKDIDVQEKVTVDGLSIKTSIDNDEFESDIYLTVDKNGAIKYEFIFEDDVVLADIDEDEPLEIDFLGKKTKIVKADITSVTIESGIKTTINEYSKKTIDGVEIEALAVTDTKAVFLIDGKSETINIGDIKKVGDIEIKLVDTFDNEAAEGGEDFATILMGEDVEKTLKDGDEFIEDDERFIFGVETAAGNLEKLTVSYDVIHTDIDDDEYQPLKESESISFPNDYFKVSFDSLTDVIFEDYNLDFRTYKGTKSLRITGPIEIGSDETDTIYFNGTDVKYKDESGDEQTAVIGDVKLVNDNTELALTYAAGVLSVGPLDVAIDGSFEFFGANKGEADVDEIKYGAKEIGNKDNDVVLDEGIVVKNPDSNGDNDKIKLMVPSDEIEAQITVG